MSNECNVVKMKYQNKDDWGGGVCVLCVCAPTRLPPCVCSCMHACMRVVCGCVCTRAQHGIDHCTCV